MKNGKCKRTRAAQYVRMSTDMQRYSIENQSEAIALYAAQRGYTIVRGYVDAGKSGLSIDGRDALKKLIDDVTKGRADFKVILVLDVSRWGRFQDTDESAHYEYVCKEAGVTVEYCAEPFANDGSLTATVLKNIKRAMASEYSRELSAKTFAGQCRIAAMGFRRGSAPGYGLRRSLVDAEGRRKGELGPGQWKNISTDRIILVPGPPHEIATVNRIFRMFADEGMTLNDIARWLNREGILNALGRPWLYSTVCDMLSNEKYIGNNVFNRSSVALKSKWKRNPPNRWIRAAGAFEPIVPRDLFMRARRRLAENFPYTSNELLDTLTAVWCRYGTISVDVLEACPVAPAVNTYRRCFGGLMNAYVKIGFVKPRVASWTKNQKFRAAMNNQIVEGVCTLGGEARLSPGGYVLRINDELTLSTSVVRLVTTDHNDKRWRFGYKTHRRPDILIVARLAEGQEVVRDYFCLPYLLIGRNWLTFSDGTTSNLEPFQANSLSPILQMFARVPVRPEASFRLRFLEDFETDAVAAMKREAWPSAGVQEIIAAIIRRIRILLADLEFVELLNSRGIKTMPCVLAPARESVQTNEYGPSLLEFAAVWGFVSRIMANADFAAHVTRTWPGFATEMRMAYLAILTEGPLARLPTALAFGQMPVAPSHSPLR